MQTFLSLLKSHAEIGLLSQNSVYHQRWITIDKSWKTVTSSLCLLTFGCVTIVQQRHSSTDSEHQHGTHQLFHQYPLRTLQNIACTLWPLERKARAGVLWTGIDKHSPLPGTQGWEAGEARAGSTKRYFIVRKIQKKCYGWNLKFRGYKYHYWPVIHPIFSIISCNYIWCFDKKEG